jgi:hypothetical protein
MYWMYKSVLFSKTQQEIWNTHLTALFSLSLSADAPDCVIDHTQGQTVEALPAEQQQEAEEICSIQAHRVIVAARCDWFRRALLSGMREAIDRYPHTPHVYSNVCCSYVA